MAQILDKNRLQRIKIIDRLFSDPDSGDGYSVRELYEMLNVSRSTVERDIEVVRGLVDDAALVETVVKVEGDDGERSMSVMKYRYAADANPIFANIHLDGISSKTKRSIENALQVMTGLKVNTLISVYNNLSLESEREPIVSYTVSPTQKSLSTRFSKLYAAIEARCCVSVRLRSRKEDVSEIFHVIPWYLREYNRRWYLLGKDLRSGSISHYALDRIERLGSLHNKDWEVPPGIESILEHIVGISIPEEEPVDVLFWLDHAQVDFMETKPIHKSMVRASDDEIAPYKDRFKNKNGRFYKITAKINYELRRELMSCNSQLIVLSPKSLRDEIAGLVKEMYDAYENL